MSEVHLNPSTIKRVKYFPIERTLLKIAGISLTGDESYVYKIYSWISLILFNYTYPFVVSLELFKHSFNDVVDTWFYFFSTFMADLMIVTTARNRIRLGRLMQSLQKEPFIAKKERGGDDEEKLIKSWVSFSYNQAITFAICVILSVISQMVYTVITRLRSSDYHDWNKGFAQINVVNTTFSPNYEIFMMYQNLSIGYIAFNCCSTTLIISGLQAFVGTQYKILQNNLRRLTYNSQQKMIQATSINTKSEEQQPQDPSRIPWRYLQEAVKEAVSYHLDILNIVREIEDIFSQAMLSLYIGTLAMLCTEVYRASMLPPLDIRTIRVLMEALSACFHSTIICYSGEKMTSESEQVTKALYESNFVGADLRFQKSLVLIIRGSQKPIRIKAGKMIETSLMTLAWILRTSYSVYMVLRSTNLQEGVVKD